MSQSGSNAGTQPREQRERGNGQQQQSSPPTPQNGNPIADEEYEPVQQHLERPRKYRKRSEPGHPGK